MPTHTDILNSQIDPDSPVTQSLMTAYRDNIEAAKWHPYDDGDGVLWDGAVDPGFSTLITNTFVAGFDYRALFIGVRSSSSNDCFLHVRLDYSDSTNSGSDLIAVLPSGTRSSLVCDFDNPAGLANGFGIVHGFPRMSTALGDFNIDGAGSATATVTNARFIGTNENVNIGKIVMLRRRSGYV